MKWSFRVKLCFKKSHIYWKDSGSKLFSNRAHCPENEKHHALGENLIMPAYKYIVMKMLSSCSMRNWKGSILHSMISCHIDDMSHDAEELWGNKQKNNSFPLQGDESIDFIGKCCIVTFVWFLNGDEI